MRAVPAFAQDDTGQQDGDSRIECGEYDDDRKLAYASLSEKALVAALAENAGGSRQADDLCIGRSRTGFTQGNRKHQNYAEREAGNAQPESGAGAVGTFPGQIKRAG
ncbi:hypothetical protein [Salinisphaera hydrothermalis]|uniref:Uncharacterized protein n=1 Tax=Salinisphaera hydrothermalis (strain C41B8) TaxID=1304275 RepID=A0A084IML4_SALHC|nr:hypothetical protein [Salinisphaera hydrothermalis]KEZ77948.1 hypothetical protein C41B8_07872 [Salinisphaera hydrothermalis C41B8]